MDLLDRINKTAYLGKEFLTWLWFRSERQEGLFRNVEGFDGEVIEIWFDDKLVLDTAVEKVKEVNSIRGESPTEAMEAYAALRVGKKVADAKLRIIREDREWVCSIKAEELALSGVKIPGLFSKEEEEHMLDRLLLIGELEGVLDALYKQFATIRLDDALWARELNELRVWVHSSRDSM